METSIKGNGLKAREMEKELAVMRVGKNIQDYGWMIRKMVKEFWS